MIQKEMQAEYSRRFEKDLMKGSAGDVLDIVLLSGGVLKRLLIFLIRRLLCLRHPDIRAAVLEKVFMNPRVRPLFPEYYPSPGEARAQRDILQNIRSDLAALKIPHTSGMLARKRVILEAVVSQLDSNVSKFHSILGTRKENLVAAVERLRSASTGTSGRYAVPVRKK
jgi:hypothetical protein